MLPAPALKNTLVCPSLGKKTFSEKIQGKVLRSKMQRGTTLKCYLHLSFMASMEERMMEVHCFRSGWAACTSFGLMMMNRWTKSGYTVLQFLLSQVVMDLVMNNVTSCHGLLHEKCHKLPWSLSRIPIWETSTADPDPLKHPVAGELFCKDC